MFESVIILKLHQKKIPFILCNFYNLHISENIWTCFYLSLSINCKANESYVFLVYIKRN